jgi:DNA-binding CsgD family transcriptional regulator
MNRLAEEFATKSLRVVLALGVADALLDLAVGSTSGDGLRRVVLGLACLGAWAVALINYRTLARVLPRHPWLILLAVGASAIPIALDGGLNSALLDVPMPLAWVAAVAASTGFTLLTGAVIGIAFVVAAIAAGLPIGQLLATGNGYNLVTNALDGPLLAIAGVLLAGSFRSLLSRSDAWVEAVHAGAEASTPALGRLIRGREPLLLVSGSAALRLTGSEQAVVDLLADGLRAKQIAHVRGTSVQTVRTQIKLAKRKTGARTLDELVAIACRTS